MGDFHHTSLSSLVGLQFVGSDQAVKKVVFGSHYEAIFISASVKLSALTEHVIRRDVLEFIDSERDDAEKNTLCQLLSESAFISSSVKRHDRKFLSLVRGRCSQ